MNKLTGTLIALFVFGVIGVCKRPQDWLVAILVYGVISVLTIWIFHIDKKDTLKREAYEERMKKYS